MDNKLDYIKRAIKRTYKRYTGERTDGKATIQDVAKFFNIPICEENQDDFEIVNIDFKIPVIEVLNTKTNTIYKAEYTSDARLFNYWGDKIRFNIVNVISPISEWESLYYIGGEEPIISRMVFKNNDKKLIFIKENANHISMFSLSKGIGYEIQYGQDVLYDGEVKEQKLLTKRYVVDKDSPSSACNNFQQLYNYGVFDWIKTNCRQDKYSYEKNSKVIYVINQFRQEGVCSYLRGICLEDVNKKYASDDMPIDISTRIFADTSQDNPLSAMVFEYGCDGLHHYVDIIKEKNDIKIKHNSFRYCYDGPKDIDVLDNEEFILPLFNEGNISIAEIENIIGVIEFKLKDKKLARIIANELCAFGKRIALRNNLMEEESDPLAPKELIDKSFEDLANLVGGNKEEYFRLAEEQFQAAIDLKGTLEQGRSRVLEKNC